MDFELKGVSIITPLLMPVQWIAPQCLCIVGPTFAPLYDKWGNNKHWWKHNENNIYLLPEKTDLMLIPVFKKSTIFKELNTLYKL